MNILLMCTQKYSAAKETEMTRREEGYVNEAGP